jgi:hypothetical protein
MKIEGSGSSSQRHGSADLDPDPHQKCHGSGTLPQGGEEEAERARSARPTAPESLGGTAGFFGEASSYATPAERRQVGGLSVMFNRQ